jgi:hypothetical protein
LSFFLNVPVKEGKKRERERERGEKRGEEKSLLK